MRKIFSIILFIMVVLTTCSCTVNSSSALGTEYGSFTIKKTSSYDGKYYAFMTQDDHTMSNEVWSIDESAVRPDYIITK